MSYRPRIFISTVSKELKSARQLVANTLLFMGYDPVWQDVFEIDQGDLRGMLRNRIDQCQGMIHIVGHCYGAEPPEKDEKFGRVSYTQYEALYAREKGKKVWVFTLEEGFPTDIYEPEPDELKHLQLNYIKKITIDKDLYYPLISIEGLEAGTLKLRNELAIFRRNFQRWSVTISVILIVLLGATGWIIYGQKTASEDIRKATDASGRAEAAAKDSALSSKKTTIVAQHIAIVAEKTNQMVGRTEKKVALNQNLIRKATDASGRAEAAAKDSALSSRKTTENTKQIIHSTEVISSKMGSLKKETSIDPRKELANMGIKWGTGSFVEALMIGDLRTIGLFLDGGMKPTTRHKGTSAILYGFQNNLGNNQIQILDLLVSKGFDLNTHLTDKRIMANYSHFLPEQLFQSDNMPDGYGAGDLYGKRFVGSLLFWEVMLDMIIMPQPTSIEVIKYLLAKKVDTRYVISYLDYKKSIDVTPKNPSHTYEATIPILKLLGYKPW